MKINILLIEDDIDDVELLQEALSSNDIEYEMKVLPDGNAAIKYIHSGMQCPDIIVMDFNLPKVHGKEVLKEIRNTAVFKNIPVLILTTSSAKEDMTQAQNLGANSFLVKPATLEAMKHTAETIYAYATKGKKSILT